MMHSNFKTLRPHQERAISMIRSSFGKGKRSPILMAPTGAGKTLIAANIVRMALAKGSRVTFCVPAISLIDQTVAAFMAEGIDSIGVIQADHHLTCSWRPVQVASVQTLASRKEFPMCELVLVDEAHMQFKVIQRWMKERPDLKFVGLSATPWSRGLGKHYDDLLISATTRELIDTGYLSDYAVYAPTSPDLKGVKVTAGDYQQDQLSAVMQDHKLVGDIVSSWLELGNDDPTLVFAVDRAHARAIQASFAAADLTFGYCDAHTDLMERTVLFERMARREIKGIVNVGTLTTGVDADVRTLVLARPTKSPSLFVQIIGRALRNAEGKSLATIIDHSDTTLRLGMPADIHFAELSNGEPLEVKGKRDPAAEKKPKACPKCKAVKPVGVHACPVCGFEPENIRDIYAAPGTLTAVTGGKKKTYTRTEKQAFYSGLLTIRRERGRSPGWVSHTYRDKFGVWPRAMDDSPSRPSPEVLNFVKSKDIAFAKRRETRT